MPTLAEWPFDQARNTVTVTVRQIMDGSKQILLVSHDMDDHGWQFLTGEDDSTKNVMLVALDEVVSKDASLNELADLPPGWLATRKSIHEPWVRALNPPES